jgi:hypothetical protein
METIVLSGPIRIALDFPVAFYFPYSSTFDHEGLNH